MFRRFALSLVLASMLSTGAAAQTINLHKAAELAGGYFAAYMMAAALVAECYGVPAGEFTTPNGKVIRWRGEADHQEALELSNHYRTTMEMLVQKGSAVSAVFATDFNTFIETQGGRSGMLEKLRGAITKHPGKKSEACAAVKAGLELNGPPRVSPDVIVR